MTRTGRAAVVALPAPAQAETWGNWYYLQGVINGGTATHAQFGSASDQVYIGDWDGDGRDTLMLRRDNVFHVTNSPSGGATSYSFKYGSGSDVVIVGDWNGDGRDTLGVRRGNEYHLTDGIRGGVATRVFRYGSGGDELLIGDWNGDGRDTFGVRRGNEYHLTNTQGGYAQILAKFGSGGDSVIVGDWNADKRDTLGVRRGNEYHLANAINGGRTDVVNRFGAAGDTSFVGDWNADGVDTIAVRRSQGPPRTIPGSGTFAVNSQVPPGLYRTGLGTSIDSCYWERVSDFSGTFESIIANAFEYGPYAPMYVEIKSGDVGFYTSGCPSWTEVRASDPPSYLTVDNGQYRVGFDMAPGVYAAPGGSGCYWERLSSFDGEFFSIITNGLGDFSPIVSVSSGDTGFTSSDCGTWTRISGVSDLDATEAPTPDKEAFDRHRDERMRVKDSIQGR